MTRRLIIGAHYDTTPNSPGANDNGSGVAAALVVAEELSDDELPFDLRFVLFGSEEIGLERQLRVRRGAGGGGVGKHIGDDQPGRGGYG